MVSALTNLTINFKITVNVDQIINFGFEFPFLSQLAEFTSDADVNITMVYIYIYIYIQLQEAQEIG